MTPGCPRTCCAGQLCTSQCLLAFLRELSKLIELLALCQPLVLLFSVSYRDPPGFTLAALSRCDEPNRRDQKAPFESALRAAQKYQTATSIARAAKARGRNLPGHAMACSLRISLQWFGGVTSTSPDHRTSFLFPL